MGTQGLEEEENLVTIPGSVASGSLAGERRGHRTKHPQPCILVLLFFLNGSKGETGDRETRAERERVLRIHVLLPCMSCHWPCTTHYNQGSPQEEEEQLITLGDSGGFSSFNNAFRSHQIVTLVSICPLTMGSSSLNKESKGTPHLCHEVK